MDRVRSCRRIAAALVLGAASALPARAQTPPPAPVPQPQQQVQEVKDELERLRREFDALRRTYDDRIAAIEDRLARIAAGPSVVAVAEPAPAAAPAAVPVVDPVVPALSKAGAQGTPAPSGSSKVFNPDISVNGNFVGAAGQNPFATLPALQLSEVEAAFQAVVDPYAKADFFLSVNPEGIEVEEGYITFTSLPAKLQLKAGKMRAQFGKMNTLHTHGLPSVDRPLVTENLVGGEGGFSDPGLSLSRLIANPFIFLELTGEVYSGQSEVFQSTERSRLAYVGRLRAYRDLSESANLDIGSSIAFGPSTVAMPMGAFTVPPATPQAATDMDKRLVGIDATFRYRPLQRAIYRRLNVRSEFIWSRQEMPTSPVEQAFGFYVSGEYQFARRWYVGGRADRSGRTTDGSAIDNGGAVFMTFWPTEFSQIRGEYRHIRFAEGARANEFLFQFNFSIGAHGAHAF
jgi:hypothetical protein